MVKFNLEKYISIVQQAGLSKNESIVYLKLLNLGEVSMTSLAIRSGLARPSAYSVIESLQIKGFVSKVSKGKRSYYSAIHPKKLQQVVNYRKNQIDKHMSDLIGIYSKKTNKPKIQMLEGVEGLRQTYREVFEGLGIDEEILIFTNIGRVKKFFPEIPKLLAKKTSTSSFKSKVRELVYDDDEGRGYSEEMKERLGEKYEIRFNTDHAVGDSELFILQDKIIYFSLSEDLYIVVVENPDLAKTQKAMFEMAWEKAKTK